MPPSTMRASRTLTFDGQIFDPDHPENRLFATHFCRNCGQEHHPVMLRDADGTPRFEKREIDDVPLNEDDDPDGPGGRWGFLMPEPVDGQFDFQGRDEDYPDAWLEETKSGETRLKATYRRSRAELLSVHSDGSCDPGGRRAWFMPGRFKFCPACREHHSDSTRDINRLASLSAEGRSSATTIIIAAILRWMGGAEADLGPHTRKLLAFTDNRQDAALQAGHFNDFIFVTLLRGAILASLEDAGDDGLLEDQIGPAVQRMLGFLAANVGRRAEWLVEPELKGANLLTAERGMREALAHRFWIDQRRGWRFTNPNLEQLGLIEARYVSLDELARDGAAFESAPAPLRRATPEEREQAARALFDVMRRGLAVECDALDRLKIEGLAGRMRSLIKAPWSLNEEQFRSATTFMPRPPSRRDLKLKDEDLILRGSRQSAIGRALRTMKFGGERPSGQEIAGIVEGLLQAATKYGLATQVAAPVGGMGWRLIGSAITFHRGSGDAEVGRNNPYFCGLYEEIARLLAEGGAALFGFEGREHTAQVEGELRQIREARFRFGPDDRKALEEKADQLKEMGEDGRFLPTLFCSPTMELGVDISAMNVVYMRNVPPTPANYAQRSGRAGRSGQAAFIVAYCAAQSPHDQYFFRQPKEMVDGVVRPPSIDLTNPDLIESHLHAEWLAASGVNLNSSIALNLDMAGPGKPLLAEHWKLVSSAESKRAGSERTRAVLEMLAADFRAERPAWFSDPETHAQKVVDEAPQRFAGAFDRWRDLLAAAERQVDDAARTLRDYSISPKERRAAEMRQAAGNTQTKLLLRGSEAQGSDFYVYRYLATEGFLPGYNFPRLPLMAFVPGARGGKGERYIQRARFLAISEFGPYSLVYHEGRAYRVDRALLKEAGGGPNGELPTFSAAICPMCGAGHEGEAPEECHVCRHPLAASHIIRELHRIENVGTREAERITANDEERRRQGFDLQTTFSFAQARSVRTRVLEDLQGEVLTATFAPATLVRRVNKGLRRRRSESEIGFWIDPRSGYWAAAGDAGEAEEISPIKARQRITPVVEDRKNALLIRFPAAWRAAAGDEADRVMATIQHALARGVETVYQLEEGEILAEPTPTRKDRRALFFFEAAEGGAGALSRLINEHDGFRSIARAALENMHYLPSTFEAALASGPSELASAPDARCVAGCYRCLLSYFNQPDHELIDRRNQLALQFLIRLAHANGHEPARDVRSVELLDGCPPPDPEPIEVEGVRIDLIWRAARLGAIEEDLASHGLVERLAAKGVELIVLPRAAEARRAALACLAEALGSAL